MKKLILLAGATAVGKTDLAIEIARYFHTEIVSADSRQLYREMCIGTAVPDKQQLATVPHYMIQNHSVTENYNASNFEFDVLHILDKLFEKHEFVVFTGGSGLYIDAVLNGIDDLPDIDPKIRADLAERLNKKGIDDLRFELKTIDPEYYAKVDLQNPKRIQKALEVFYMTGKPYSRFLSQPKQIRPFETIKIVLDRPREELYWRINRRVELMIQRGLVDEVENLLEYRDLHSLQTVAYKEIFDYLDKKYTLAEAIDLIQRNTRKYARKQISWFRRDKQNKWFSPEQKEQILELIIND